MAVFRAFKPEAMNKIAKAMGYTGDMGQFQSFIEQDPMRQQQMQRFTNAAIQMARGGVVRMNTGGTTSPAGPNIQQATMDRMFKPALPTGCLLYTSPSPRDLSTSRMPSSA